MHVELLVFSAVLIGGAIWMGAFVRDSIRDGVAYGYMSAARRESAPILFWFQIGVRGFMVAVFAICGVMALVDGLTGRS